MAGPILGGKKSSKRQMPELRPEATEINVTTPTTAWEDISSTMEGINV